MAHLDQIAKWNPQLNAIVTLTADKALLRAKQLDNGEFAGPLHGLPVVHKDLFDTAGIRTTYGSKLYEHHIPKQDCLMVERMESAGAICLGKSNTPEFGAGSQTEVPEQLAKRMRRIVQRKLQLADEVLIAKF